MCYTHTHIIKYKKIEMSMFTNNFIQYTHTKYNIKILTVYA